MNLTEEGRMKIAELVSSDGWKILVETIWQPCSDKFMEECTTAQQDIRFLQGLYMGYKLARNHAENCAKKPDEFVKMRVPDESLLMARTNRNPTGY